MSWGIAVLAFVCALELVVILALDRYAHGLSSRIDRLEKMAQTPVPASRRVAREVEVSGAAE